MDPETFTDHASEIFSYHLRDSTVVEVSQQSFRHTKQDDDTGAVVWDDAVVFCKFLEKRIASEPDFLRGKSLLDLGSGTGLVGIVASLLGSTSTISDQNNRIAQLLYNISLNEKEIVKRNSCIQAVELDWSKLVESELSSISFDFLVASGCIYHEDAVPLLINTISHFAHEKSVIYIIIDFRFDVSTGENEFSSPVIDLFMKTAPLAFNQIQASQLDSKFIKNSIKVFECCLK